MSRSLNKVMLIGNVGKDPEVNYTPSGIPVAQFRLATTEQWRDKDGQYQEHTEWHTIVAWRGLAEVIGKLVHRGSRIYVEGKLQTRIFDDQHGNKKYFTEVVADNMLMLDSKKTEDSGGGGYDTSVGDSDNSRLEDDIPF
ncbi:MAG: single-stranded DNA-binding protein [Candidatus Kapabacteria bacterium]|nr:single-stranded DNA-binding protein [Candidatus Kapabacteria bacterium]MBX7155415.1 single-stranded DNA-binding protein [Bacteroidota bacterium]